MSGEIRFSVSSQTERDDRRDALLERIATATESLVEASGMKRRTVVAGGTSRTSARRERGLKLMSDMQAALDTAAFAGVSDHPSLSRGRSALIFLGAKSLVNFDGLDLDRIEKILGEVREAVDLAGGEASFAEQPGDVPGERADGKGHVGVELAESLARIFKSFPGDSSSTEPGKGVGSHVSPSVGDSGAGTPDVVAPTVGDAAGAGVSPSPASAATFDDWVAEREASLRARIAENLAANKFYSARVEMRWLSEHVAKFGGAR